MRAITKTGRAVLVIGYIILAALGVWLAVALAVLGYAAFSIGLPRLALILWGATTATLMAVALGGSLLAESRPKSHPLLQE